VTGASRQRGIAATVALGLAESGWHVATTYWLPYDQRMPWGNQTEDVPELERQLRQRGAATAAIEADLADPATPSLIFDSVEAALGRVTAWSWPIANRSPPASWTPQWTVSIGTSP